MHTDKVGIKQVLFANVSGFLVYTDNHVLMVDTGHRGMTGRIISALRQINHSPDSLSAIVITHTHYDHAGGAAELKRLTGAKIIVHAAEAENLRSGDTSIPAGTRWKGKLIAWMAKRFAKRVQHLERVQPDILVEDQLDLREFGIPGLIMHTPGHTPGSLSVILENETAIVGDSMLGLPGKEHYPPFAENKSLVLESWQKLLETGSKIFYPAHGNSIGREEIVEELPAALRKYGPGRG